MTYQLETTIDIAAPAETVWKVLTDLETYSEWNPFITASQGSVAVGQRLVNRMQPPGGKAMTFKPTVTVVESGKVFEWLGVLGLSILFAGRHRFELEATPTGTRLVQSEQFSGILVGLMRNSLDTQTRQGFEEMNVALKTRAEAQATVQS